MHTDDINEFKQRLLNRRNELLQSIKKSMENSRRSDARLTFEIVQDNPDRSVDELLKHVDSHVLGTKASELASVDSALLKIREGTYGVCESCGALIVRGRLEVFPDALYCVSCQGEREHLDRLESFDADKPVHPGPGSYLDDDE
jgi:DnaK suppressor protein